MLCFFSAVFFARPGGLWSQDHFRCLVTITVSFTFDFPVSGCLVDFGLCWCSGLLSVFGGLS